MDNREKNYYEILGITEDERKLTGKEFSDCVSKKYKKLALKWHPDRWVNGTEEEKKSAEEKFKEISEANSILSDETKRQQYDNGGNPFEGMDMGDFFHGVNPFEGLRRRQRRGDDIQLRVTISLKEAYSGCQKTISVPYDKPCPHCKGSGSEDGQRHTCPHCHGTGQIVNRQSLKGMLFQSTTICPYCHGTGTIIENKCKVCHGTGTAQDYKEIKIVVPKGVRTNMAMTVEGMGGQIENGISGDLIVVFFVVQDDYFQTDDGANLYHEETVEFNKALLGCEIECNTIDGSKTRVKLPECTKDGDSFNFYGKGMPILNHPGSYGDYRVIIRYSYPKKLSEEQKEKLKNF